jgi:hypothetical protein
MGWNNDIKGYFKYPNQQILDTKLDKLEKDGWITTNDDGTKHFYSENSDGFFTAENGVLEFDNIYGRKLSYILDTLTYNDTIDHKVIWTYENESLGLDTKIVSIGFDSDKETLSAITGIEQVDFYTWFVKNSDIADIIEEQKKDPEYYPEIDFKNINSKETIDAINSSDLCYDNQDYWDYRNEIFYEQYEALSDISDNKLIHISFEIFLEENSISISDDIENLLSLNPDSLNLSQYKFEIYKIILKELTKIEDDVKKYELNKNIKKYFDRIGLNMKEIISDIKLTKKDISNGLEN